MIDKGVCDNGYIWNPSNCECEWGKSCGVGEYLDYENCKYRKKLVDKLVEECSKTVEEMKTDSEDRYKSRCSSCVLYLVVFNNYYNQHWNCYLFCLLQIHES